MPREALVKISKPRRMQSLALNLNALAHAMFDIRISESAEARQAGVSRAVHAKISKPGALRRLR